jgi:hypothetical protein
MSTPPIPPSPPPLPPRSPYAPPDAGSIPPGGSGGQRLPWEERDRLGFFEALIQTVRLVVTDPADAFSRLRPDGDLTSPILFGVIMSWVAIFLSQIWQLLFGSFYRSLFSQFPGFEDAYAGPGIGGLIGTIVLWPIFFLIALFIGAGILHLCFMLVSATEHSPFGFEGTLKVVAYTQTVGLASVVPVLGGFIMMVWGIYLEVIGAATVHRTTQGKALLGVLIPLFVCCFCGIVAAIFFGAMIAAIIAAVAGNAGT